MMGWSTPSMQKVIAAFAPNATFYSQMYHVEAVIRRPEMLEYDHNNFILQLGGSNPERFYQAGLVLKEIGIPSININVGCPSHKVQQGDFGACLMKKPELVADCLNALKTSYRVEDLSVKCRIGIDHDDSPSFLHNFIEIIHGKSSIDNFSIHARKAWLKGLSPKQNREIPPLNYERVYELKKLYSEFKIAINGGIRMLESTKKHLLYCDEVMLGRLAIDDLYTVHLIDCAIFNHSAKTREALITGITDYSPNMNRVLQSVYKHISNSKSWRQKLASINDKKDLLNLLQERKNLFPKEI